FSPKVFAFGDYALEVILPEPGRQYRWDRVAALEDNKSWLAVDWG
ncbi:MAG: hypothetical protein HRU40_12730, partial [Saprospiraceae bacterium]|nr:hypothetical protein [Saprospiraceae bacterium]